MCKASAASFRKYPTLLSLDVYVIVIHWGQGIKAVNEPIPRAQPEDEVCLRCHKLATKKYLATSESLIHLLLIVLVTYSVPRNKTNQNLKVEMKYLANKTCSLSLDTISSSSRVSV